MSERAGPSDWLAHHARRAPTTVAAIDLPSGRRHTWRAWDERANRAAAHLRDRFAVERGDRVALLAAGSSDVFALQWACFRLGAVVVPLNWRLTPAEIAAILDGVEPAVVVVDDELAGLLDATGPPRWTRPPGDVDALAALPGAAAPTRHDALSWDDPWVIVHTSGTTGAPKGAVLTPRTMTAAALDTIAGCDITRRSVGLTVVPTFHVTGLNVWANPITLAGGTVVVGRRFDPARVIDAVATLGISHLMMVPVMWRAVLDHPSFDAAAMAAVAHRGSGGAPAPADLLDAFAAAGAPLEQGYGMTEAGPTICLLDPEHAVSHAGSVGHPVLGAEVRIVAPSGRDVDAGAVGELLVRGAAVTPGFWRDPAATAAAFSDGWLRTGDAARVDEDGFVWIVDRWKDVFISGGENVMPAEIEAVLLDQPGVGEAAVVGVPDERWGEVGVAFVVLDGAATGVDPVEATERLLSACRGRLAGYKVPRRIVIVEHLPRNAAGKVQKPELRRSLQGVTDG